MRYYLLLACTVVMLAFQACNSSSTPTAPPDYFKGLETIGSYWVYENHEIDTNGVVQPEFYLDSTWVAGVIVKAGKNATILVSESKNGPDTTLVAREGNKLYAFLDPIKKLLNPIKKLLPIPLFPNSEPTWNLVAHLDTSATWPAFTPLSFKQDLDSGGTAVTIDVKVEGTITTKGDTTFTAANKVKYSTKSFGWLPKISGKIAPKATPFISFPLSSVGGEQRQFFADGVGLVGERTETWIFNFGDGTLVPPRKVSGSLRTLLRYNLK